MKAVALQSTSNIAPSKQQQRAVASVVPASPWFLKPMSAGVGPVVQRKASCACGGGCPRCAEDTARTIQTKLHVSTPGDPYEQEADHVADQVMRVSDPVLQTQRDGCLGASTPISNDEIQRQGNDETGSSDVAADFTSSLGSGLPLDTASRAYFEPRFGRDFGSVRIHNGPDAATAAARVQARAFTLGRDVVFAAGEHNPSSERGRRLLAHELSHVVQQATPIVTGNAGLVRTRVATRVLARTVDDWLTRSPNVGQFTYTQLLGEIDELNQYLQRQTSSSADTGRIEEAVASLRAEVNRRDVATGRSRPPQRGRRRGTTPSVAEPLPARYPRILTEMTSVAYTDPSEMRAEYDLIMEWLARPELSRSERRTLTTERDNLAPQLNIDRERVVSERHAERVRTALMPPDPAAVNALTNLARTIQDIPGEPDNPNLFYIYHQGERVAISREQAESLRNNLRNQLQRAAQYAESNASHYWDRYHSQAALNREHPIIAGISGWLADVEDPRMELTDRYFNLRDQVRRLQARVTQGDMVGAAAMLPEVENNAEHIRSLARAYYEGYIEGAEIAVRRLEFTRNASFAVAGAIAAVVAAPVVAGFVGAGGLGLTGAGATAVTIGGTGLVVGTGVGTVRGTSAAVGTLAAGGSWHDVGAAFTSEGLTGFREGFMSGAGGAAARSVGLAIGVGGSLTRQAAMRVGSEMLINGTTAMADSLWQSCRSEQGCNVAQAVRVAVVAAAQSVPGALLGGSNNPVVRNLVAPFTAAATSYVAARANGASSEEALAQAGVALASNIAMTRGAHASYAEARATHGRDADAALVERGRSMGASARRTVVSTGRRAAPYLTATMIGLADALPAARPGYGGTSIADLSDAPAMRPPSRAAAPIDPTTEPLSAATLTPHSETDIPTSAPGTNLPAGPVEAPVAPSRLGTAHADSEGVVFSEPSTPTVETVRRPRATAGESRPAGETPDSDVGPDVPRRLGEHDLEDPMVDLADRQMLLGQGDEASRVLPESFGHETEVPTTARVNFAEDHHIATRYRRENAAIFRRAGLTVDDNLNLIRNFEEHGQLRGWYDWRNRRYSFRMRGHHPEYNAWVTRTLSEAVPAGIAPDIALGRIQRITQQFETIIRQYPEVLSHGPAILPESLRVITY